MIELLLRVKVWFITAMDIYIIHECYIVNIIYKKNTCLIVLENSMTFQGLDGGRRAALGSRGGAAL
jgi:hypothetical protein